jgi:signal transduction protein with GAF and PtsI domain
MSDSSMLDLEKILNARLEMSQQERLALNETIENLDTKIKNMVSRIGPKVRETHEDITSSIRLLEVIHSKSTQTKADEREAM